MTKKGDNPHLKDYQRKFDSWMTAVDYILIQVRDKIDPKNVRWRKELEDKRFEVANLIKNDTYWKKVSVRGI